MKMDLTTNFGIFTTSVLLFLFYVAFGPNPIPESVTFTRYEVAPLRDLGEGFKENFLLNNAERLFENEIKGPEAFEIVNGELYTSLHGGFVVKVYENEVVPVVKFGEPCLGWVEESKCGRPLGIKAFGDDYLFIADAYFGIFKYNLKTKQSVNLVSKHIVIDGKTPQIFNGIEVAKDGTVYWTHSSSDFSIQNGVYVFLADGSGRLIKYDPVTQKNTVLLKDLFFANGVVLSPDEDYLLVAETGHSRILKFHLKGPKMNLVETFIDGLPGVPDNLRRNGEGGYFVPLVLESSSGSPLKPQFLKDLPWVRRFAARLLCFFEWGLRTLNEIYPTDFLKESVHFLGHLESLKSFYSRKTIVLDVDSNGKVTRSFQGYDGSVTSVSDVIPYNGYLYFGSPSNNYLARIELSKLGIRSPISPSAPFEPAPSPKTTVRPTTTAGPSTTKPTTRPPPPSSTSPQSVPPASEVPNPPPPPPPPRQNDGPKI